MARAAPRIPVVSDNLSLCWFPSLGLSLFIVIRLLYSTPVQDTPLVYHRQFLFVLRSTSNSYTSARRIEGRQKVGHKSRKNEKGSECVVRGYVHKKLQRLTRPIDTKSENNGTRIYEISENCNERVICAIGDNGREEHGEHAKEM